MQIDFLLSSHTVGMEGSLVTVAMHSYGVALSWGWIRTDPRRRTHSLPCGQECNISSPSLGFAPAHFLLTPQAFGCSLCIILCPCNRRCDTLDSLPQSLQGDKANDQDLINSQFVRCLVSLVFFFLPPLRSSF